MPAVQIKQINFSSSTLVDQIDRDTIGYLLSARTPSSRAPNRSELT